MGVGGRAMTTCSPAWNSSRTVDGVGIEAVDAPAGASAPLASGEVMATTEPKGAEARRRARPLLARRGRPWDAHEVAGHLMACRAQMVNGLKRKTPWAGMDSETLESCFGHGAAVIARVAASGQRPEWRTPKDLEKAQIAAFRHQALDHWKRVNAQSRQGDRLAIAFDPDRHAAQDAPMDRLFLQPDLHAVTRDLLSELADEGLHAFWAAVLENSETFKSAGDRLGLTKAQVMARTRAGRLAFAAYVERRETGELCRERGQDIAAVRAGVANPRQLTRAEAHLECCYACALVHRPESGAFERGILGVAPVGLLLRLATRAGDIASIPATRWAEAGAGARSLAGGLAAVTAAASGVGIGAAIEDRPDARQPRARATSPRAVPRAPNKVREAFVTPALVLPRSVVVPPAPSPTAASRRTPARPRAVRRQRAAGTAPTGVPPATSTGVRPTTPIDVRPTTTPTVPSSGPATSPSPVGATPVRINPPTAREFSFERGGTPRRLERPQPRSTPPPKTPPPAEFAGP